MQEHKSIVIGGLAIKILLKRSKINKSEKVQSGVTATVPVSVLFLLHGRLGSSESTDNLANRLIKIIDESSDKSKLGIENDLLFITFVRYMLILCGELFF